MRDDFDEFDKGYQDWDLEIWEKALTIDVGTSYACRECSNLVIVTKGGVGVLDMTCCGKKMESIAPSGRRKGDRRA